MQMQYLHVHKTEKKSRKIRMRIRENVGKSLRRKFLYDFCCDSTQKTYNANMSFEKICVDVRFSVHGFYKRRFNFAKKWKRISFVSVFPYRDRRSRSCEASLRKLPYHKSYVSCAFQLCVYFVRLFVVVTICCRPNA